MRDIEPERRADHVAEEERRGADRRGEERRGARDLIGHAAAVRPKVGVEAKGAETVLQSQALHLRSRSSRLQRRIHQRAPHKLVGMLPQHAGHIRVVVQVVARLYYQRSLHTCCLPASPTFSGPCWAPHPLSDFSSPTSA